MLIAISSHSRYVAAGDVPETGADDGPCCSASGAMIEHTIS